MQIVQAYESKASGFHVKTSAAHSSYPVAGRRQTLRDPHTYPFIAINLQDAPRWLFYHGPQHFTAIGGLDLHFIPRIRV